MDGTFLTREEAARIARVSVRTLQRWEQMGLLCNQAVEGGRVTYHPAHLERFLTRRKKVIDISSFARPR